MLNLLHHIGAILNQKWSYRPERKREMRDEIGNILPVILTFDAWPWKTIGHLFYATSSFAVISQISVNLNGGYNLETLDSSPNLRFLSCVTDLKIWQMTLKTDRAPLLCYPNLYASFCSHLWIQSAVTARKFKCWSKHCCDFCDLDFGLRPWWLTIVITPVILWWYKERNIVKMWKGVKDKQANQLTDR